MNAKRRLLVAIVLTLPLITGFILPPYQPEDPVTSEGNIITPTSPAVLELGVIKNTNIIQDKAVNKDDLDTASHKALIEILESKDYDNGYKLKLLKTLAKDERLSKDLRDAFAESAATLEMGVTKDEEKSQTEIARLPHDMNKPSTIRLYEE